MKREDFVKIIKLRSCWKIDRRKENYKLPNGERLSDYVETLVKSQMKLDNLGISSDGNLYFCSGGEFNTEKSDFDDYMLLKAFGENETCGFDEMSKRFNRLVLEIVGC